MFVRKCLYCDKQLNKRNKKFCNQNCYWKWMKGKKNKGSFRKGSKINLGRKRPDMVGNQLRKGISPPNKGTHIQINDALKVWRKNGGIVWNKGLKGVCKSNKGSFQNNHHRTPLGENHHFWKGGKTKLRKRIEALGIYKQWRKLVYERDNYICQKCKQRGGKLNPHHLESFADILDKYKIRTIEDAKNCKILWDINNGQTLCENCHIKTHSYLKNKYNKREVQRL